MFIVFSLVGCGENQVAQANPKFNNEIQGNTPSESLVAQNNRYELHLDKDNMGVTLVDKATGEKWGTSPENSGEEQLDEFGMPIKRHPQVESPILVSYKDIYEDSDTLLVSYTGAVKGGRVKCETIENGILVEYYFDESEIMIPVEYALLHNGVKISINPKNIQEGNNKVISVSVAPFWCSIENDTKDSYLFVPDGSGALINAETHSDQGLSYSEEVYGTDLATEFAPTSNNMSIRLPVYGAKNGNKGTCAIITEGADSALIEAKVGAEVLGYTSVYCSFKVRGTTSHTATLYGNQIVDTVISAENMIKTPLSVTYYPLMNDEASYIGMANTYRDYLLSDGFLSEEKQSNNFLNLTILGGTMIKKSFLGVPYDKLYQATTIKQAEEIVDSVYNSLNVPFSVNLKGFGETGVNIGKVAGNFKFSKELGSISQLKDFLDHCEDKQVSTHIEFELLRFGESGNGYSTFFDSVTNVGEQKAYQYFYDISVRKELGDTMHYLLARKNIVTCVEKLLDKTSKWKLPGVSVGSLSNLCYSDYQNKDSADYYAKSLMSADVQKSLNIIKESKKKIMSTDANAYAAVLSDSVIDTPTESSQKICFYTDVPFYQMVFRGSLSLYGNSINLAINPRKELLKAVESGCGLNYTVTENWDNYLLDATYSYFYNSVYSDLSDDIISAYGELSDYYKSIGSSKIISHEILDDGVRKTVFENGVYVYVNYTEHTVTTSDGEVPSMSFRLGGSNQ